MHTETKYHKVGGLPPPPPLQLKNKFNLDIEEKNQLRAEKY